MGMDSINQFSLVLSSFNQIAVETATVYIFSILLKYFLLFIITLVSFYLLYKVFNYSKEPNINQDERGFRSFMLLVFSVVSISLFIANIAMFPAAELVGMFAPRGYVIYQALEKINEKDKGK